MYNEVIWSGPDGHHDPGSLISSIMSRLGLNCVIIFRAHRICRGTHIFFSPHPSPEHVHVTGIIR